ncbi:hypothetical protein OROGR_004155 [Orobanche gracilis]
MDFWFMGGSMGSVVGEKITRLIEYATNKFLPLIIVCASWGERMQEGSLSLMQMAKISSALYDYQSDRLFFASLTYTPSVPKVYPPFIAQTNRQKQQMIINGNFSFYEKTWKGITQ